MVDGVCVWWSDEDGWGALRSNEVESEVFVHFSNVDMTGYHSLRAGQRVRFEVEPYPPGQDGYFFRAHNVAIVRPVTDRLPDAAPYSVT